MDGDGGPAVEAITVGPGQAGSSSAGGSSGSSGIAVARLGVRARPHRGRPALGGQPAHHPVRLTTPGITSLSTDGTLIYGSGFAYLGNTTGYGNLEGVFAADPATGAVRWVEDCHGDTYSVYPNRGKDHIYAVGHAHFCANIGGFGESAWRIRAGVHQGGRHRRSRRTRTPSTSTSPVSARPANLLHWYPDMNPGAATTAASRPPGT